MRIALFAQADYSLVQRRAAALAGRGHDVHVLSLQPGKIAGCTVHQLPKHPALARLKLHYLAALPAAYRLLKTIDPDIVDLHGVSANGVYSLLPGDWHRVATLYGPDLYDHASRFWPLRMVARAAVARADLVYSSTPAIEPYLRETLGLDVRHKLAIQTWGIPLRQIIADADERRASLRAQLGVAEDVRIILHSRQIAPLWRIPLLIEAAPVILAAHPRTTFWFAYPPPNFTGSRLLLQYQQQAVALGIADRVRWLGYFPYEDIISVMHAADVYVCIGSKDLLASSVLEAMATGMVPVLADRAAYQEVIEHGKNGFLLPEVTPQKLAAQTNAVLASYDAIQPRVAAHNRRLLAEHYDEAQATSWLLQHYERLMRNGHRQVY